MFSLAWKTRLKMGTYMQNGFTSFKIYIRIPNQCNKDLLVHIMSSINSLHDAAIKLLIQ